MPSAVTIARFSTPARMIRPYRERRRNVMRPTSTTAAAPISTKRSFGMLAPRIVVVSRIHGGVGYGCTSGAPDALRQRTRGQREPDRHEHLLDRPPVEWADQDELDQGGEHGADREPEEAGHTKRSVGFRSRPGAR